MRTLLVTLVLAVVPIWSADTVRSKDAGTHNRIVFAFPGDDIIPQVVDGAGWQTSFTLVNLQSTAAMYQLSFFDDNGLALKLPIIGIGATTTLQGSIPPVQ